MGEKPYRAQEMPADGKVVIVMVNCKGWEHSPTRRGREGDGGHKDAPGQVGTQLDR